MNTFAAIKAAIQRNIGDWGSLEKKIENFFTGVKEWIALVTPILKGFLGWVEAALKLYNRLNRDASVTANAEMPQRVVPRGQPAALP